ncbi:Lipase 1 [Hypsizygus marmoreus]|uniref:Carboxylic ester hydrolase n=1 Tax=Hypsizygus marmoreus TaxID=39966 RepID=A0A369J9W3_HYPMA|nr:Lipase 1 [Hypsizygus marmoreus]
MMLFVTSLPFFLAYLVAPSSSENGPRIMLGKTTLIGRDVTGVKQDFFGGIPFAEPPLGKLRLKPPVLKTHLSVSTLNATDFGPACFQAAIPPNRLSEDCLTINVFRPSGIAPNASLPVLFWTYGGGFNQGESSLYNGSTIVAQSIARGTPLIYVNFNYRLGPLGFPQGQEADDRGALNLALKDQLTALEWVQHNIGAFGGDKNKVTVFGVSAGAIMTAILYLNSPLERLARGAILQSGSAGTSLTFNAARREIDWQNFVSGVPHCASRAKSGNTFDCLRAANSSDILQGLFKSLDKAPEQFGFDPTLDGPSGLFPDIPSKLFARGQFARIPFIAGTVLDEGTVFTPRTINSSSKFRDAIIANFSPPLTTPSDLRRSVDRLFKLYPDVPALGSPFNTGNETFGLSSVYKQAAAIHGDVFFEAPRRLWMQTASAAGIKSFGYLFTELDPANAGTGLGVAHGSEVPLLYGHQANPTPSSDRLSKIMINYWISFATSLNPNDNRGIERPQWPQYVPSNQVVMQLNGANLTVIPDDYRSEQINFINSSPSTFRHRR